MSHKSWVRASAALAPDVEHGAFALQNAGGDGARSDAAGWVAVNGLLVSENHPKDSLTQGQQNTKIKYSARGEASSISEANYLRKVL